jgi:hypothetical protein
MVGVILMNGGSVVLRWRRSSACVGSILLLALVLSATWLPAKPGAADVTGTWEMEVKSQEGTAHPTITLRQEGEKVTGTYQGKIGESALEGTVRGSDIRFAVNLKFQDVSYTVTYTGTVSGDHMEGATRFGDAGSGTWSAKRKKNQV